MVACLTEEARNTIRDGERKLAEKFRAELSAQTNLANLYKCQSDEKTSKVDELSKVITDLQNMLEASAKKQEDIIKDKNRAMIDQLQYLGKKVSDITTALTMNVSQGEEPTSNSQLMAIIKYLRQEKDKMAGRLEVKQTKTDRLQIQLVHHQKLVTECQTALELERFNHMKRVQALKESLDENDKSIKMLKEDSDQHRKIGESYRLMFLEEKKKTKELTAENQTLKEVDRICNNNDEVNSEATTETSVQHSLKRARDFNQAVIKEEKHRGDDESSGQQKKPKSEFFSDSE